MTKTDCFVSLIAPLDNDAEIVRPFIEEVAAILDARRNINGKGFLSLDTTGANASPAWIIDYPARAMASWTTSFDREKSLLGANLSRAMTARARNRGRAALCSAALAGLAGN